MHTVELLPDARLDAEVRAVWRRLHDAGLRSLATHAHPTNRPHVTLVAAGELTSAVGPALSGLPLDVVLDDVVFLGRTVAWRVRPDDRLRELQAAVWAALDGTERNPLHDPRAWTPHVSLALRVPPEQQDRYPRRLGIALGRLTAARSYGSELRSVVDLSP
ncbi:2'-5' RNA ligase family protein [Actinoplanes sp. NPDC049681]|uniref:2'-5' RNA ligase family protein n=1 Tax=Actinoplanes sp. NPDC049681 TaxID=3363905 RepID=UPI00379CEEAD